LIQKLPDPVLGRRVWIAGHTGMVGSALVRRLSSLDTQLLLVPRRELDLRDSAAVYEWMAEHRPDTVILAAARVGGIQANSSFPADFILNNLAIQQAVIGGAARLGVAKLAMLAATCLYPKHCRQPMSEDQILSGPLEASNQWYAVAKIAGIKMTEAVRRQHGLDFISIVSTNLYGPGDNFDLEGGHVIPALIRRAHEARAARCPQLVIWGSGAPRREFLHVDDFADALLFLLRAYSSHEPINVGSGEEISIRELAVAICRVVDYQGRLHFDAGRPDGAPRKLADTSRLRALGWRPTIPLARGLSGAYEWFRTHKAHIC
jgi:GDP-L-fucose synthase